MDILTKKLLECGEVRDLLKKIPLDDTYRKRHPYRITGLSDGTRPLFVSALLSLDRKEPILFIVKDEKEMQEAANLFASLGIRAKMFPSRDYLFYNIVSSHEAEHERISTLNSIICNECDVVITVPDAAVQFTMPREVLSERSFHINNSSRIDTGVFSALLDSCGYVRTDMVDGVGQYSVRGCIVDFFPSGSTFPVRMELFDDEIDSISYFDILTQRRTECIENVVLIPARECIPDPEQRRTIIGLIEKLISQSDDEKITESLKHELAAAEVGGEMFFIDKYFSVVFPEPQCLTDYFSDRAIVVISDYSACADRLKGTEWRTDEAVVSLLGDGLIPKGKNTFYRSEAELSAFVSSHSGVLLDSLIYSLPGIRIAENYAINMRKITSYFNNFELMSEDILSYGRGKYTCLIMCENEIIEKNLIQLLENKGLEPLHVDLINGTVPENRISTSYGAYICGYEIPEIGFAMLSTSESSRSETARKKLSSVRRKYSKNSGEKIMSYADLSVGDYVVHINHGIGMYSGIESVTVEGITSDYIKIKYAGTDVLFLPCNQIDRIAKYIGPGADDGTLKLSKMGGTEWGKTKQKVKNAAKQMAAELIQIYAARERLPGFRFLPDDEMQREFESAFPYTETDAQLIAIDEVKRDMESPKPMDRLLCGDVGFGKTEVALRAAFKAVGSGKQVVILVPTTILALQHFQTISARVRGFPVEVEMLSRFRTSKQQEEILRKVRRGEIDILVGTHRVLSDDLIFKDLGLVIIDEEQRFGVGAKEKLRKISVGVDTLTLTATPIPRTLNMAMSGIRDMSVLEEAPGDRVPVQTYVLEHDEVIIDEAIRKELRRGGQVFYLHNVIETLDTVASKLAKIFPDACIAVAHGQMDKEELSDIWKGMLAGEIDILVCTAIIESGVDVPNANTLIIDNADRFGLSQLHQIRGRVGRSSRRAYAYFTYRPGRVLTEIAAKRLKAISEYTEFGSGFKVALRDLEIRGAGNLLGAEQSGHIENVGYDLYMKILNEAVLEIKGETVKTKTECQIDMAVSAYIPESYIRNSNQRIDVYKKISLIETVDDTVDIVDELIDRYGNMPRPVISLVDVSLLRSICADVGMKKIVKRGNNALIYPSKLDLRVWSEIAANHRGEIFISMDICPYVTYRIRKGADTLDMTLELIKEYKKISANLEVNNEKK